MAEKWLPLFLMHSFESLKSLFMFVVLILAKMGLNLCMCLWGFLCMFFMDPFDLVGQFKLLKCSCICSSRFPCKQWIR